MTQRSELQARLRTLDEIRSIIASLKTLALLETRKLTRFSDAQAEVLKVLGTALNSFAAAFPVADWQPECTGELLVAVGSERGFCGAYNTSIVTALQTVLENAPDTRLLIVGNKLAGHLPAAIQPAAVLEGASVAEDVDTCLLRVSEAIAAEQARRTEPLACTILYATPDADTPVRRNLFPVQARPGTPPPVPPVLNLPPREVLPGLLDAALEMELQGALYRALYTENQQRMAHLEGALEHLDRQRSEFALRGNALRQEEITEEIEVILLSADAERDKPALADPDQ